MGAATTLVGIAIQELPALIGFLKAAFTSQNPGTTAPTDDQVIAAYLQALASSLSVDAAWLQAHPKTTASA